MNKQNMLEMPEDLQHSLPRVKAGAANRSVRSIPFVADPDDLLPLGVRVAGLGLGSVDYRTDTITLDDRAAELFDLPAHVALPRQNLHAQIHPEDRPDVEARMQQMLDTDAPDFIDLVHRIRTSDGTPRWVSARKQVAFDAGPGVANRRPVRGLVAIMDMTPHKLAERRVQDLMKEMNHRQKNLLTVVQSIARMTARMGSPDDFLDRFDRRLRALSDNHDLLMSRDGEGVVLGALVRQQLRPFTGERNGAVQFAGPDLELSFDAIQPIGLALHELATNAAKYGALSVPQGRLGIAWDVTDDVFTLSWTESGGPAVVPPQRRGFGSTVLQSMTRSALEAEVTLDYNPDGLHWSIRCATTMIRSQGAV
ncbi:sensor histidine kinase [Loktanella sp. DJP18]|uniref:sensor histidine kinase n=1 Tax=Loktanella sp. DJP18 TaxID=3409788 RepID=UPI003BB58ADC